MDLQHVQHQLTGQQIQVCNLSLDWVAHQPGLQNTGRLQVGNSGDIFYQETLAVCKQEQKPSTFIFIFFIFLFFFFFWGGAKEPEVHA